MYPKIPHMIAVRMCDVYVGKRKGERGRAAGGKIDGWQPGEAVWLADRCVKSERASVGEEGYVLLLVWRRMGSSSVAASWEKRSVCVCVYY